MGAWRRGPCGSREDKAIANKKARFKTYLPDCIPSRAALNSRQNKHVKTNVRESCMLSKRTRIHQDKYTRENVRLTGDKLRARRNNRGSETHARAHAARSRREAPNVVPQSISRAKRSASSRRASCASTATPRRHPRHGGIHRHERVNGLAGAIECEAQQGYPTSDTDDSTTDPMRGRHEKDRKTKSRHKLPKRSEIEATGKETIT